MFIFGLRKNQLALKEVKVLAEILKELRLSMAWSQDNLIEKLGFVISKQAYSNYERGRAKPGAEILNAIVDLYGLTLKFLLFEPDYELSEVNHRTQKKVRKSEQYKVQSSAKLSLRKCLYLETRNPGFNGYDVPIEEYEINELDEIEDVTKRIREEWGLGEDPIDNLREIIEANDIFTFDFNSPMRIDGASVFATKDDKPLAAAVVSSENLSGDRQRFNFAHELGHLLLLPNETLDKEKVANKFAGAFLIPEKTLKRHVGNKTQFNTKDLLELKDIFKVSIQAILYRLKDLDLISDYYYTSWCKNISRYGWRKNEPDPIPPEKSNCLKEVALKAIEGGYVPVEEAEKIIGQQLTAMRANSSPIDLIKLPLAERRKILKAQGEKDARQFNEDLAKWESWEGDYDEES